MQWFLTGDNASPGDVNKLPGDASSICFYNFFNIRRLKSGPQPDGGNRAIAPPKFLKTYVFFKYSNKLHHFASRKNQLVAALVETKDIYLRKAY